MSSFTQTVCHHCGRPNGLGARVKPRGYLLLQTCERYECQASAMRTAVFDIAVANARDEFAS